ncbi:hypothetical protein BJV77DRAFT_963526 [Russula vinacea]|nr:hypothetical protein BJV77DRAFT_963526 [Russula vinacea]
MANESITPSSVPHHRPQLPHHPERSSFSPTNTPSTTRRLSASGKLRSEGGKKGKGRIKQTSKANEKAGERWNSQWCKGGTLYKHAKDGLSVRPVPGPRGRRIDLVWPCAIGASSETEAQICRRFLHKAIPLLPTAVFNYGLPVDDVLADSILNLQFLLKDSETPFPAAVLIHRCPAKLKAKIRPRAIDRQDARKLPVMVMVMMVMTTMTSLIVCVEEDSDDDLPLPRQGGPRARGRGGGGGPAPNVNLEECGQRRSLAGASGIGKHHE